MNEYLLFFSLFFPRLSLWIAWLSGDIPLNTVPFWMEFFITLFLPRALICFYIVTTLGWESGWLIAHGIFWMLELVIYAANQRRKGKEIRWDDTP